jgi:hypothetical protein
MAGLSISRAWDETKQVIARDGSLLTTIALALFVLPGVISETVAPAAKPGELPPLGYWTIVSAIALMVALVGQLSVIRLAMGSRLTVGEAIGHGAKRAPAYLAATLIWLLPFTFVAFLLAQRVVGETPSAGAALVLLVLLPVLIFFAIRMLMSSSVASAETVGPVGILRRSWELTRGHWWRLFAFFLIFLTGALVGLAAAGMMVNILAKLIFGSVDPITVGALLVALVTQIISAAISVLLMVMLARIYAQLAGGEAGVPSSGT